MYLVVRKNTSSIGERNFALLPNELDRIITRAHSTAVVFKSDKHSISKFQISVFKSTTAPVGLRSYPTFFPQIG